MLTSLKNLEGFGLQATDGALGATKDFYFDDASWTVRYAVVDTRKWLPGRRVLISPVSFHGTDWDKFLIRTSLTKEQVQEAPSVDEERPVSRQHEVALSKYFSWPTYWVTPSGSAVLAGAVAPPETATAIASKVNARIAGNPHLRSLNEIVGYGVQASDGEVGSVSDFLFDTKTWSLRYLVADTRKWLPGGKVLLSPDWVESVEWNEQSVHVDLLGESIQDCPTYKPDQALNREYEAQVYDHYGRTPYWV